MQFNIKSVIDGACWPALPSARVATILSMLEQLDKTQWLTEAALKKNQYKQLHALLLHVVKTVPYYHNRFSKIDIPSQLTDNFFQSLPILSRQAINQAGEQIFSQSIPKSHGKVRFTKTSGTTGIPIKLLSTDIIRFYWDVFTMRDHLWHQRDLTRKLAIIRLMFKGEGFFPDDIPVDGWGCVAGQITKTGEARLLNILSPIIDQRAWLQNFQPDTLLIFPSALEELLGHDTHFARELSSLKEIRTMSETLSPDTRKLFREKLGAKIVDMYSTVELGYIALQCPEYEHYHIQSENVLVEILNENNQPCQPGEVGRIIITALHNYASPLIRYEIGDYAEVGEPCPCGRGLPVIKQLYGRYRNWLTYPDGQKRYPGFELFADLGIESIQQYQAVQTSVQDLTLKLVVSQKLTESEKKYLIQRINQVLDYPFTITIEYVESVRNQQTGKCETFISLV